MVKSRGLFLIAFFYLLTSYFFTYVNVDPRQLSMVSRICVALLFLFLLINWTSINKKKKEYASFPFVVYFLIAPFITHLSCYLGNSQSIVSSMTVSASALVLSVYFFCILKGVSKDNLIRLLIILAVLRTAITFIEQFTYPSILFSSNVDTFDDYGAFKEIEVRSGMRRFVLSDAYHLPAFLGFYSLSQFISKRKTKYLLLFLAACLGLYMDQTRQIIFVFGLCLMLTPFLIEKKSGNSFLRAAVIVLFIAALLYFNYDTLFGELAEKTSDQLNVDYTRSVEMAFFLSRMGGLVTTLFGNGWFGTSAYGQEYISLQTFSKMYRCDVGIVGAAHMMGIVFITVFVAYIIYTLLKNRRYLPLEYKFMYLFLLFDLPLIFPIYNYTYNCSECFWGLLFYLADRAIYHNRTTQMLSAKK